MYCPQCGTQNESKQSFCRQCGQRLTSLQRVLDGRVDEVAGKFSNAEDLIAGGLLTFLFFFLSGVFSLVMWGAAPFATSVILGFIICLPIVLTGLRRVDRLRRLLDPKEEEPANRLPDHPTQPITPLAAARPTDPLDSKLKIPGSVTEHTTLSLRTPAPKP